LPVRGREFLNLAREIVGNGAERHWRGAHIHAYDGLLLECRDALARWGFPPPPHHAVHHFVRTKLMFAADADLRALGITLDHLSQRRSWASYVLTHHALHCSEVAARDSIQQAAAGLARLDAVDADPARRAAAVAAIRP
jgi:hypothetical protein